MEACSHLLQIRTILWLDKNPTNNSSGRLSSILATNEWLPFVSMWNVYSLITQLWIKGLSFGTFLSQIGDQHSFSMDHIPYEKPIETVQYNYFKTQRFFIFSLTKKIKWTFLLLVMIELMLFQWDYRFWVTRY